MLLIDKMNEIKQFNIICRLCLDQVKSSNQFVIISECFFDENPLKTIIELCGHIEIGDEDKLPKKVCVNCLNAVYKSYCFMKQCKISDRKLHDLLEATNKQQQEKSLDQTITGKIVKNEGEVNSQLFQPFEKRLEEVTKKDEDIWNEIENNSNNFEIKNGEVSNGYNISSNYEVKESEEEESSANDNISNDKGNDIEVKTDLSQQEDKTTDVRPLKKYMCEHCGLGFTSNYYLTRHIRIHTKEKPFVCEICSFSFSVKSNLKRHMLTHTGERPFICDICGKSFRQGGAFQIHRSCHNAEKPFNCTHCDKQFKCKHLQRLHIKRYHEITLEERKSFYVKSKEKYASKSCEKSRFLCSICSKGFRTKAHLQAHLRVHSGEKHFVCSFCGKSYSEQRSLRAHKCILTGETPLRSINM